MVNADVVIVGAGPAGLTCARRCAESKLDTLVLEKNAKCGIKLLASGSGKCNLSSALPMERYASAYGDKGRFVRPALLNFPPAALRGFFESRGLSIVELHDGKLFPETQRASDVLRALLDACAEAGAEIRTRTPVRKIERVPGDEGRFAIEADSGGSDPLRVLARFVVIACGGASYPKTGSTGDGAELAASLGLPVVPLRPALAPVYPEAYDCATCAGIALENAALRWRRDGKKIGERTGDVLFTHEGLSGPLILDSSRDFRVGDELSLSLMGGESRETVSGELLRSCAGNPRKSVKNIISSLGIPEALALAVLARCGMAVEGRTGATLSKGERLGLAGEIAEFRFVAARIGGFQEAMATAGGIDTRAVRANTMESTQAKGLYFAGETLDVDGDTGGFNLQFAFSSGILAADSIIRAAGA